MDPENLTTAHDEWEFERRQAEEDEAAHAEWSEFIYERDYCEKLAISYPQDAKASYAKFWLSKYGAWA